MVEGTITCMKKRTAIIGAFVSLLPLGQPLLMGGGIVLTSTAVMLSVPAKVNAESASYYYNRGNDKLNTGDYYGAIADYNRAIELNPRNADAYINRGVAKRKLEDYYGSIADYSKAIEINPRDAKAYLNRGVSKSNLDDKKGACKDYKKAISLGSKSTEEWLATEGGAWCRNM